MATPGHALQKRINRSTYCAKQTCYPCIVGEGGRLAMAKREQHVPKSSPSTQTGSAAPPIGDERRWKVMKDNEADCSLGPFKGSRNMLARITNRQETRTIFTSKLIFVTPNSRLNCVVSHYSSLSRLRPTTHRQETSNTMNFAAPFWRSERGCHGAPPGAWRAPGAQRGPLLATGTSTECGVMGAGGVETFTSDI